MGLICGKPSAVEDTSNDKEVDFNGCNSHARSDKKQAEVTVLVDHPVQEEFPRRLWRSKQRLVDKNGILKIANFGLADFDDPHHSVPQLSRVVTLWYRPPELLPGTSKYGVGVDLWITGCILGESYYGKPILPGTSEDEQLHKIFKLCGSPSQDYWRRLQLNFKPQQPYTRCVAETFKDLLPPAAVPVSR